MLEKNRAVLAGKVAKLMVACALLTACGESDIERYYPSPSGSVSLVDVSSLYGGAAGSSSAKFYIEEIYLNGTGYAHERHLVGEVHSSSSGQYPVWLSGNTVNVCDLSAPEEVNKNIVLRSKGVIKVETNCMK